MVHTSILLVLLALVSITAATVAWFSIADRTKVRSMSMEITTGVNLRFDLDAHDTFDEYVKTLEFEQSGERIEQEKETLKRDKEELLNSFCWRITKPVRLAGRIVRKVVRR